MLSISANNAGRTALFCTCGSLQSLGKGASQRNPPDSVHGIWSPKRWREMVWPVTAASTWTQATPAVHAVTPDDDDEDALAAAPDDTEAAVLDDAEEDELVSDDEELDEAAALDVATDVAL